MPLRLGGRSGGTSTGNGQVWLSYDDPVWLARRHGLGAASEDAAAAVGAGLERLAAAATGQAGNPWVTRIFRHRV